MSALAEDRVLITEVAKELVRQAVAEGTEVTADTVWRAQRPETKAGYRTRAIQILVAVDLALEAR